MNFEVENIYGNTHKNAVTVSVEGSKSITARALLIAALANGESKLFGAQFSDDCTTFINCLRELGIKIEVKDGVVSVEGCNGVIPRKKATINVGSAGTAARFLPAMLAFQDGEYTLESSEQMKSRPIAPLIKTLTEIGAKFEFHGKENSYPFTIRGTKTPKLSAVVNIDESSQFLSGLLLSAVCAKKPFKVKVEGSHGFDYVNMTINCAWSFGVNIEENGGVYTVCGGYTAKRYEIEPDVSAACYFYAMNKILGTDIRVKGVMPHSMQGDIKFINLLKTFDGGKVDMSGFSDQALTLAAIAPYLSKPTEICNVAHIRKQECDRISAIATNLKALNVKCEERADGIIIYPSKPQGVKLKTFGDHRVAMSFAVTGLRADGIIIENAEVCSKTFKGYFEVLEKLCKSLKNM